MLSSPAASGLDPFPQTPPAYRRRGSPFAQNLAGDFNKILWILRHSTGMPAGRARTESRPRNINQLRVRLPHCSDHRFNRTARSQCATRTTLNPASTRIAFDFSLATTETGNFDPFDSKWFRRPMTRISEIPICRRSNKHSTTTGIDFPRSTGQNNPPPTEIAAIVIIGDHTSEKTD